MIKNCSICETAFEHKRASAIYCSTPCRSSAQSARRRAFGRKRYHAKPEYRARNFYQKLWSAYRLTKEDHDAMLHAQGGACAICGKEGPQRKSRINASDRLCVDHCHKTGKVRGLLCIKCNSALGMADDSVERLMIMAAYLQEAARDQQE